MAVLLLNVALGVVDLAAVGQVRRGELARPATIWSAAALVALLGFSQGRVFPATQALAWILFVHLPLSALAASLWLPLRARVAAWSGALVLVAVGAWSVFVEPYRLEVTHLGVEVAGLERPLVVALVSDLQTDRRGNPLQQQAGGARRQVALVRRQGGAVHAQLEARAIRADAAQELIRHLDGLHQRPQVVIAVLPAVEDLEDEIDLGGRVDADCLPGRPPGLLAAANRVLP